MRPSKRKLDDVTSTDSKLSLDVDSVLHPAKYRKAASGSDFSTFEIGRALDMSAVSTVPSVTGTPDTGSQITPESPIPGSSSTVERPSEGDPDTQRHNTLPGPIVDLMELLDVSELDTREAIEERFSQIAFELLHNHRIEIRASEKVEQLELLEIEFYLYKTGCHEDPFTHASPEQSQCGRWYFHRPPSRSNEPGTPTNVTPAGYRGGTRKGLDITMGRPPPASAKTSKYFQSNASSSRPTPTEANDIVRGGVLLRSMRRVSDGKVTSGPSLLVDEVLRLSGASEIAELVAVNWAGDISAFATSSSSHSHSSVPVPLANATVQLPGSSGPSSPHLSSMYIVRAPPTATVGNRRSAASENDKDSIVNGKLRVFRSPRIGLDISHPSIQALTSSPPAPASSASSSSSSSPAYTHPRVTFIAQPYRFFVSPYLLTANGRGQTFTGVHDAVVARGHCAHDEELLGEIVRLTGVKGPTAAKYLSELRKGRAADFGEWVGPKGKAVISSVPAWLRMVGTLRDVHARRARS